MLLTLSTATPWDANYCNDSGQVIYHIESKSLGLVDRHMTVSKVIPSPNYNPENEGNDDEAAFKDEFNHIGEVEYRTFKSSKIRLKGIEQLVSTFFRKGGCGFYGR